MFLKSTNGLSPLQKQAPNLEKGPEFLLQGEGVNRLSSLLPITLQMRSSISLTTYTRNERDPNVACTLSITSLVKSRLVYQPHAATANAIARVAA